MKVISSSPALTLTDMFMSLLVGRVLDRFLRVGVLLQGLNVFQIISSLMYFAAKNSYWILASRLIGGDQTILNCFRCCGMLCVVSFNWTR